MDRDTAAPDVTDLPGDRAREWVEYHHESAAPSTSTSFVWDRTAPAEGPFCTDVDGNVLMDFTSHVAAAPLGYNNPKIMEPLAEFDLVDPLKIAGQDFYVAGGESPGDGLPGSSGLMERLTEIAHPLRHGHRLPLELGGRGGRERDQDRVRRLRRRQTRDHVRRRVPRADARRALAQPLEIRVSPRFPEISGIHDAPFCDDRNCTAETCSCGFFVDGASQLRRKLDPERGHIDPDDVAYLILEPIQGEGDTGSPPTRSPTRSPPWSTNTTSR